MVHGAQHTGPVQSDLQGSSEAAGMQGCSFFSRAQGRKQTKQQALHNGSYCMSLHIHICLTSGCLRCVEGGGGGGVEGWGGTSRCAAACLALFLG